MRGLTAAVITGALVCCAGVSCVEPSSPSSALPSGRLAISTGTGPVRLSVEIARTPEALAHGLMGRPSLPADAGMAFLFDRPNRTGFWMRNTLIPLSIAFWGADHRIVGILEMTPCHADPCPLYSPGLLYRGAAEANRGWFAGHGVRVGDLVRLTGS